MKPSISPCSSSGSSRWDRKLLQPLDRLDRDSKLKGLSADPLAHFLFTTGFGTRPWTLCIHSPHGSVSDQRTVSDEENSSWLRMSTAIIHLVHEARGLDVNPTTIMKFKNAKDAESVDILT